MKFNVEVVKDIRFVMWEKVEMSDSQRDEFGKPKKDPVTKKMLADLSKPKIQYTKYTFRNDVGEILTIMKKGEEWRDLEGKDVNVFLLVDRNEFNGKSEVKMQLIRVEKA